MIHRDGGCSLVLGSEVATVSRVGMTVSVFVGTSADGVGCSVRKIWQGGGFVCCSVAWMQVVFPN